MVVMPPFHRTFLGVLFLSAALDASASPVSSVHAGYGGLLSSIDGGSGVGHDVNVGVAFGLSRVTSVTADLSYRRVSWQQGIHIPEICETRGDYVFHTLGLGLDVAVPNRLGSAPYAAIGLGLTRRAPQVGRVNALNMSSVRMESSTIREPAALMITPSLGVGIHFRFRETRHGFHAGFIGTLEPSTLGARVQLDL